MNCHIYVYFIIIICVTLKKGTDHIYSVDPIPCAIKFMKFSQDLSYLQILDVVARKIKIYEMHFASVGYMDVHKNPIWHIMLLKNPFISCHSFDVKWC